MAEKKHIQHLRSKVVENGKPKLPTQGTLAVGEIAVNYAEGYETLSIENSASGITAFSSDDVYTKNKLGDLFTGNTTVTSAINGKQDTLAAGNGITISNNTISANFSGSYDDLTNKPTIPTIPTNVSAFNNDSGYITSSAISGKVDTSVYNTYTATTATALNGKQDTLVSGTNIKTINNENLLGSGNITINCNVPIGGIIIWGGGTDNIPSGFLLCDGGSTSGYTELSAIVGSNVPDLRDRFVLGGGGDKSLKTTGGSETVTLTIDEMPSHSHQYSKSVKGNGYNMVHEGFPFENYENDNTTSTGGGQPHNNMPPYYVLSYIIRATN